MKLMRHAREWMMLTRDKHDGFKGYFGGGFMVILQQTALPKNVLAPVNSTVPSTSP
jgi:hypothetical protein